MQKHSTYRACESQAAAHPPTSPVPGMISPPLTAPGVTDFCYSYNAQELGQHYSEQVQCLPYLTATQMLHIDHLCNTLLPIKLLVRHLWALHFQESPKVNYYSE